MRRQGVSAETPKGFGLWAAMNRKTIIGIAQQAALESGLRCRARDATQVPEDKQTWCVNFTGGCGQARVRLRPGSTDESVKEEIAEQLRGRRRAK